MRWPGREAAAKLNKLTANRKQFLSSSCVPGPRLRVLHMLSYLINEVTSWVSTIYSHMLVGIQERHWPPWETCCWGWREDRTSGAEETEGRHGAEGSCEHF